MPVRLQTDRFLFLLSFFRDGVTKLNLHEPLIIYMPDFVLIL